jgi:hypothetical protein
MKTLFTLALATALISGYFSSHSNKDQSRIVPDPDGVVIQYVAGSGSIEPCKKPGRIRYKGECWLEARIPQ